MSDFNPEFVPLDKAKHDRDEFNCGEPEITNFLQKTALQHSKKGFSRTYVLTTKSPLDNGKFGIISFFSISSSHIKSEEFTPEDAAKLPKYPIPAILIGQLGVHGGHQGKGLGQATLAEALKMAYRISMQLGAFAVLVDCINDSITRFYEGFGFSYLASENGKVRMYLPMKTIKQLM